MNTVKQMKTTDRVKAAARGLNRGRPRPPERRHAVPEPGAWIPARGLAAAALVSAALLWAAAASAQNMLTNVPAWYAATGLPTLDTDGDGIPDAWELRTFGDPFTADSHLDRDGDGLTDLEEFLYGSDPRTYSTMGDFWPDKAKRDAGLPATHRVTPGVTPGHWLAWLGWDAQTWDALTATNGQGFTWCYFVNILNAPPYLYTEAGYADFWLETRADRPVWVTVRDALTTNSFPIRAGEGRHRVRAAYGGPVSVTLDPAPGPLAAFETNALWYCETAVSAFRPNTVVLPGGPPPIGDFDSVDGLLLTAPPPTNAVRSVGGPPQEEFTLLPLRVTDGALHLGGSGWHCIPCGDPGPCAWPVWEDLGVDAASAAAGGVDGGAYILHPLAAWQNLAGQTPPADFGTHSQAAALPLHPSVYGRVSFVYGTCKDHGQLKGAEQVSGHAPDPQKPSGCDGISCECAAWDCVVGFCHGCVCIRNLSVLPAESEEDRKIQHCLGIVWDKNKKTFDLADLVHTNGYDMTGVNIKWEVDGKKLKSSKLELGDNPKAFNPRIFRIKMIREYAANGGDEVWDRLFLVVNNKNTKKEFDDWYDRNKNIDWTTNLPPPFASITVTVSTNGQNGVVSTNVAVVNLSGSGWHPPERATSFFHHDAVFEMRSLPITGDYGHQAMYDEEGILIESGIAAGSADIFAPYDENNSLRWDTTHRNQDVYPFVRALQLDGNPVKVVNSKWTYLVIKKIPVNLDRPCIHECGHTRKYLEKRPALPTGKR